MYLRSVLRGLKGYQQARDLHFITFSCYRRGPLLGTPQACRAFEQTLERDKVLPRGLKSMCDNVPSLKGLDRFSYLTQHSAFGCMLG